MTKWRPARQRTEFQNYPRPLGRICTQPLEVLEDRKGDAGIGHEPGVAAPNWLGEDQLIADSTVTRLQRPWWGQGLHMEASESSGAARPARVLRVRTGHNWWYSLLTDTDSDFFPLLFTLLIHDWLSSGKAQQSKCVRPCLVPLFSSEKWKFFETIALLFICDKYYPIID